MQCTSNQEAVMRRGWTILTGLGVCGLTVAGTALPAGAGPTRSTEPLVPYSAIADNPLVGVSGVVHAVRTPNGKTNVTLQLRGFDRTLSGRTFGAHVHVGPCADGVSAGVHYTSPDTSVPLELREVWLDFTVNPAGNASATATRDFAIADGAAQAVVIHQDPTAATGVAGPRLGCIGIDL
jgi:hypothetical protein